ncbi:MAG: beta-Ala-His dipeptidase [Clostridia bacterium]|nr:beta-Ala-His dipeptidase [Clostridia bacterium]
MENFAYPKLMQYFREISAIPRPSYHEDAIADFLVSFAQARGFSYVRDEWNNVLISAPATAGLENRSPVLLQGHTDMVCEKNKGVEHDFLRDPIALCAEGDWLRAEGTTLGADNGVAVAAMLTILDGEAHPPIECLFTSSEEVGLDGAKNFDYTRVSARTMLNMDGADDGEIIVGCAGGARSDLFLHGEKIPCEETCYRLSIRGLAGGHSGEDIHRGRANANCLLGRLLSEILTEQEIRLASVEGGNKDNAIPREASAVLWVMDFERAKRAVDALWQTILRELCTEDSSAELSFVPCETARMVFDSWMTKRLVTLLSVPNGVLAMEENAPDLVQFSRNLGVIHSEQQGIKVTFSSRSAKNEQIDASLTELDAYALHTQAEITHHSRYPGWEIAERSELREKYAEIFSGLFGRELRIASIHAGLECGLIKQAVPTMDMISCGPRIKNLHSPDERLDLRSLERFFLLITEVLKTI